jgi:hypothetical protein
MLTCCGCRASPPRTPYASPARTFHACRHGQRYCHELCRPLAEHSAPYEAPSGGALASKLTVTYIANVLRTVARCCRERGWGGGSAQVRHHAARVSFRLCMDRIVWIALYGVRGTAHTVRCYQRTSQPVALRTLSESAASTLRYPSHEAAYVQCIVHDR